MVKVNLYATIGILQIEKVEYNAKKDYKIRPNWSGA